MNKMLTKILPALIIALLSLPVFAQATPTQQQPQHLDAAVQVQTSASSAATVTIPAVSGQYAYIVAVDIANCAGTTVTAAAPLTITTTNLGTLAYTVGTTGTAGMCNPAATAGVFPTGIKSAAPGTAVTFVLPTFTANQVIRLTVYYYYGP